MMGVEMESRATQSSSRIRPYDREHAAGIGAFPGPYAADEGPRASMFVLELIPLRAGSVCKKPHPIG